MWLRREPLRSHVTQAKCSSEPQFLLLYNEQNISPTFQDKLNSVPILFEVQSVCNQGIIPPAIIQCDIVSMGKSELLYDNWICNVVSRNAFVSKQSLAKSNIT